MEERGVSPQTKRNLELLGQLKDVKQFYLAGGTACALHFGHRLSYDLDFFSNKNFNSKRLSDELKKIASSEIKTLDKDSFLGTLNNIKISFFYYRYPLIDEALKFKDINIASKKDLTAMKIDALQSRGTKRDFVDLYTLLTDANWSIAQAIDFFTEKYQRADYNLEHIVKSLIYFEDAENDNSPEMLIDWNWQKIKAYFIAEAKKYQAELLK